ncbi:MAG: NAD-dependent protein deacylase [Bacteroidetes bacterium GWA2_31_9]|nr:MAG: NAD-dependent protein deacylase [Bacteroidetes bacterium GWA2_31_9]
MKKLVVLTGAGISAESGIKTFRDMGGLWEEFDIMEVASPIGWNKNPELVLKFYNDRRKQLEHCEPNFGHIGLKELEQNFNVHIITQNVDNLHERAGSKHVLHLHGELTKVESTKYPQLISEIGYKEIKLGDKCEKGFQLRPHIVWFGEAVPALEDAIKIARTADIFVVIGTSLNVYPAASLIDYVPNGSPIYLIDPNEVHTHRKVTFIKENASVGVGKLMKILRKF